MGYYDDDFFYDYDEFDAKIEEFKESIKKGLKQEIKEKIKYFEEENRELRNKVINLEKLERDLQIEIANTKNDYFKAKFNELLEKCVETEKLYTITQISYSLEKCDECDKNREITFVDKKGIEYKVKCDCDRTRWKNVVKDCETVLGCGESENRRITFILEIFTPERWGNETVRVKSFALGHKGLEEKNNVLILDNLDIEKINKFKEKEKWGYIYFKSKEEAQKYADYLNSKEN